MIRPDPTPGFGKPGSVDPASIPRLPPHLQREAVLLLTEMGRNALSIAHASGLGSMEVMRIINGSQLFALVEPEYDMPATGRGGAA